MTVMLYGIELNNAEDCFKLLIEVEKLDNDAFYYADEESWSKDYCPPTDWADFHDYFCDMFETNEEYEEFKTFIDKMEANGEVLPELEEEEDPHQAGWDAWYSSRGC